MPLPGLSICTAVSSACDAYERWRVRQEQSLDVIDELHRWLNTQRARVPEGSATAEAIDYSLRRWAALTRFLHDGRLPLDNNWLFAASLRAGQRAAAIMSLIQSAKLNGHDPHA